MLSSFNLEKQDNHGLLRSRNLYLILICNDYLPLYDYGVLIVSVSIKSVSSVKVSCLDHVFAYRFTVGIVM